MSNLVGIVRSTKTYIQTLNNILSGFAYAVWPLNDASGNVANDSQAAIDAAYNGTKTLGVTGIGDGQTAAQFYGGVTSGLNVFAASPINMAEGWLSVWIAATAGATYTDGGLYYLTCLQSDATHGVFGRVYQNQISFFRRVDANLPAITLGVPSTTRWVHYGFVWSQAAQKVWGFTNGTRIPAVAGTLATMTGALSATGAMFGANTTVSTASSWPGRMAYPIIGYGNPSDAMMRLMARMDAGQICFDGDSRSDKKQWPEDACEQAFPTGLRAYGGYGVASWAVSGNTVANMISLASAGVDTVVSNSQKNVLVVWAGVNSVATGAAQIYADLQTYIAARRAAGWDKIILCSEIDAQGDMTWHNTVWPALNALLNADHSFADGYVDLGADARLQNALDTTYYNADKVHLVAAGYSVVASLVAPVLAATV